MAHLSISVIIPAYNSSKTILRALNSVIRQTHAAKEIIVVDDGSQDNTCELVQNQFPSVILIKQKNAGAAAARNAGVRKATGELIAFLDSDDFWHKRKLECQFYFFERDQALGLCSTHCRFMAESEDVPTDNNPIVLSSINVNFEKVFIKPFLGTPSVMIRRSIFEMTKGFDENLETAEDVDLWIRAAYVSQYILIHNELTFVVIQEESLSTRAKTSPYEAHLKVIDKFMSNKKLPLYFRAITARKARAHVLCNWGSGLLISNDLIKARQKLVRSLLFFPNWRSIYLLGKTLISIITPTKRI